MRAIDARHYWLEAIFRNDDPGWDSEVYPFSLPVLRGMDRLVFHPKVTFLVGENGSGKSTLIEALAVAWGFNAEGGTKNFNFNNRPSHSPLHRFVRPVRGIRKARDGFFLRAESYFNLGTEIERLDSEGSEAPIGPAYGDRSLHEQSHGESFFALFDNRFHGHGLYILDEPEAALSPTRQMTFLVRMHELIGQNSQFIIATHSPIILGYPDADIWQVSRFGLNRVDYEDTEHVQVTRQFLNHRDVMLNTLLDDK
ncbi:hmcB [Asticcacaulis biprosthecium C19]|uniref:HmcB n=1 Tax=Asticcacaulis biprosthecium C19 TaxID=715226 RepID=F4QKT7_9CAUL|nr:AAA family ATPase [Asticcacaulis biprosthecium]EGF93389.1 hmcB [Asticcacaulis biprosthecium C19]